MDAAAAAMLSAERGCACAQRAGQLVRSRDLPRTGRDRGLPSRSGGAAGALAPSLCAFPAVPVSVWDLRAAGRVSPLLGPSSGAPQRFGLPALSLLVPVSVSSVLLQPVSLMGGPATIAFGDSPPLTHGVSVQQQLGFLGALGTLRPAGVPGGV